VKKNTNNSFGKVRLLQFECFVELNILMLLTDWNVVAREGETFEREQLNQNGFTMDTTVGDTKEKNFDIRELFLFCNLYFC
jgi:hypothetical protein